jgi:hypothetical protein
MTTARKHDSEELRKELKRLRFMEGAVSELQAIANASYESVEMKALATKLFQANLSLAFAALDPNYDPSAPMSIGHPTDC